MKTIPAANGGHYFVFRVPHSWNQPHGVSFQNSNRFHGRNSGGAHELSLEELRMLFTRSASAREQAKAFHSDRVRRISDSEALVPLALVRGKVILHIIPLSAFAAEQQVDLQVAYRGRSKLCPIGATAYNSTLNFDGVMNLRGGDATHGYTQLYRNGIIEAVKVGDVTPHPNATGEWIRASVIERYLVEIIPSYLNALQELEVAPPISLRITIDDVLNTRMRIPSEGFFENPPLIQQKTLALPEVAFERYGTGEDYQRGLKPAFDAFWNAASLFNSPNFAPNGIWIDRR